MVDNKAHHCYHGQNDHHGQLSILLGNQKNLDLDHEGQLFDAQEYHLN